MLSPGLFNKCLCVLRKKVQCCEEAINLQVQNQMPSDHLSFLYSDFPQDFI